MAAATATTGVSTRRIFKSNLLVREPRGFCRPWAGCRDGDRWDGDHGPGSWVASPSPASKVSIRLSTSFENDIDGWLWTSTRLCCPRSARAGFGAPQDAVF